jgi:glutamyl-tRNA synthetase
MPSEDRFGAELRPEGFRLGTPRAFDDEATNWRFAVEPGNPTRFEDQIAGAQSHDIEATTGDFLVWTKRGQPSYQLAVVVDDARQGVTRIVRGDDLLPSAARQLVLWRSLADDLEWGAFPEQWHLPLVRGADGRRLAKRHGDTRLDRYRDAGVPAERVIGLVASWSEVTGLSGKTGSREPMSAAEFFAGFDPDRMSRSDVVFTEADDRWLTTP